MPPICRQRLDLIENEHRTCAMDSDTLASYPWIVVRFACRRCGRGGAYRLARLAAKFGSEMRLDDLVVRISYDCPWRGDDRNKAAAERCEAYLPDLERRTPPDLPPGLMRLQLVKGGKA